MEPRRHLSASLSLNGAQTITPGATINVSNDAALAQSEMSLVANPTNPLNLVGFSHRLGTPITCEVYSSSDGGLTWSTNEITNADDGFGTAGNRFDPAVIFDAGGTAYILYGHRETNQTRLISARSTDGGLTFGEFRTADLQPDVGTTPGVDKWYMYAGRDPSSGNLAVVASYVVFAAEGANTDARITVIGTRDGALNWTTPLVINDDGALAAVDQASYASPIIDSLGRLAVSWHDTDDDAVLIDRDTDGLWSNVATFGNDVTVRTGVDVGRGTVLPPAQPERGLNAAPMLAVWNAVNWLFLPVVEKFDGSNSDLDVWVGVSSNFGDDWTFRRIDESLGTEFNPWLDVDQSTGTVNVLYYTTDGDVSSGNDDVRPRLATSNDGGTSWSRTFLSTQQSNETGGYGGDYLEYHGLVVRDGTAHGLWPSRYAGGGSDLDAFTASAATVSSTGSNTLFLGERGGADDSFLVRLSPANPAFLEAFVDGVREFAGLRASVNRIVINPGGGTNTFDIGTVPGISSVAVNGTNNADSYVFNSLGANMPLSMSLGGGADTVRLGAGASDANTINSPVTIFGDAGGDTLHVGSGNADALAANVTFDGGAGGGNSIVYNDASPTYSVNYDISPTGVNRDGFNQPFLVAYQNTQTITINGGAGAESVSVRNGVTATLHVFGNAGNDNFTVGGGNLSGTFGHNFVGGPGTDQITFDDHLDATARIWDIRRNEVFFGGLIPLGTTGFESVGVLAGTGADEITFAGDFDQNLNINGGDGFDRFLWNDARNRYPDFGSWTVNLHGGGDALNNLTINQVAPFAHAFHVSSNRIYADSIGGTPDINYANFIGISVTTGNQADRFNVYGTDAGSNYNLSGGDGADYFYMQTDPATRNNVTINGQAGNDTLAVDDSVFDTADVPYSFVAGSGIFPDRVVRNTGPLTITTYGYTSMQSLIVNGTAGNNAFNLDSFTSGAALAVNGFGGDDVLEFGNNGLGNVTNLASFAFDGGDNYDTFNLNNQTHSGTWTYTRNLGTTAASSTLGAGYLLSDSNTELMRLNGGPSGETFNLNAVAPGARVEAYGAGGIDIARLTPATNSGEPIEGPVYYDAGTGGGNAVVFDQADTTGDTFHLDQASLGASPGDNLFGPGGSFTFAGLTDVNAIAPALTVHLGSGSDTAYAQPLASGTATINFNAQNLSATEWAGDGLNLALAAAANYVITDPGTGSGNVVSDTTGRLNWNGVELPLAVDDVAPTVPGSSFEVDAPQQALLMTFSEDVSNTLLSGSVVLTNLTTNETIASTDLALAYDTATNTATFTFPNFASGVLADGDYRLVLGAGAVTDPFGNPLQAEHALDFFFMQGDANRDRSVNLADFNILAANFGTTGGAVFSRADFNYDGSVNLQDFNILASRFGNVMAGDGAVTRGEFSPIAIAKAGRSAQSRRLLTMLNDELS